MKTYDKIETVFERGEDFKVIDVLRRPEFGLICKWVLTEKVDGTNVRLHFTPSTDGGWTSHEIGGRTDNAQLPTSLLQELTRICDVIRGEVTAICAEYDLPSLTLFGEGYGAKIQKGGGNYRSDQGFILFDVMAGSTYLEEASVTSTSARLGVPRVPILDAQATIVEAVGMCRHGFQSTIAESDCEAEGVVAKPIVPLYDSRGRRVMWKLKCRDFRAGKR